METKITQQKHLALSEDRAGGEARLETEHPVKRPLITQERDDSGPDSSLTVGIKMLIPEPDGRNNSEAYAAPTKLFIDIGRE